MRIGIDIDGVLTDIEQWQLDIGSKKAVEKAKIGYKKYHKHTTIMNCYYEVVSYT